LTGERKKANQGNKFKTVVGSKKKLEKEKKKKERQIKNNQQMQNWKERAQPEMECFKGGTPTQPGRKYINSETM